MNRSGAGVLVCGPLIVLSSTVTTFAQSGPVALTIDATQAPEKW